MKTTCMIALLALAGCASLAEGYRHIPKPPPSFKTEISNLVYPEYCYEHLRSIQPEGCWEYFKLSSNQAGVHACLEVARDESYQRAVRLQCAALHPEWTKKERKLVEDGTFARGMSRDQVLSILGTPKETRTYVGPSGKIDMLIYSEKRRVTLLDSKFFSIDF